MAIPRGALQNPALREFASQSAGALTAALTGVSPLVGLALAPVGIAVGGILDEIASQKAKDRGLELKQRLKFLTGQPALVKVGKEIRKDAGFPAQVTHVLVRRRNIIEDLEEREIRVAPRGARRSLFGTRQTVPARALFFRGEQIPTAIGIGRGLVREAAAFRGRFPSGPPLQKILGIGNPLEAIPWDVIGFQFGSQPIFFDDPDLKKKSRRRRRQAA